MPKTTLGITGLNKFWVGITGLIHFRSERVTYCFVTGLPSRLVSTQSLQLLSNFLCGDWSRVMV